MTVVNNEIGFLKETAYHLSKAKQFLDETGNIESQVLDKAYNSISEMRNEFNTIIKELEEQEVFRNAPDEEWPEFNGGDLV